VGGIVQALTRISILRPIAVAATGSLSILLVSAAAQPPERPLGAAAPADAASSAMVIAAPSAFPWQPTRDDSLRAEAELPPSAIRAPLERYFHRYSTDRALVRRISRAVLRESRRQRVPPSLIAAVLVTENTTLRPEAESSVGAQGLMQVMPMHAGARICDSDDLVDVDSNICHGTMILARNLRVTATPAAALLRYNGCVRGTNTPDCHRYPGRVLARASRVREEILAGTGALSTGGERPVLIQLAGR
jgi:soluble lytic murein transglycosylase-like protein